MNALTLEWSLLECIRKSTYTYFFYVLSRNLRQKYVTPSTGPTYFYKMLHIKKKKNVYAFTYTYFSKLISKKMIYHWNSVSKTATQLSYCKRWLALTSAEQVSLRKIKKAMIIQVIKV